MFIKMNYPRILFAVFTKPKKSIVTSLRNFHGVPALNQHSLQSEHACNSNLNNNLFFTNLPKKKKEKKPKISRGPIASGTLVIDCKNSELNHYSGMVYGKFDEVPLASKGWRHRKSKGDYFTILPFTWHPAFVTKEDLSLSFEENGISKEIVEQLKKINVTHPTVIQAKACRHLLNGENLFISAECGSGKTLSYLIAMIENVLKWKKCIQANYNSPIGIILLPTRELAIQVGNLANKLSKDLGINCQTLIGGNIEDLLLHPEMDEIDILICSLKVLLKHLKVKLYSTLFCKHVVIDEADSFLEKSFLGQLKSFIYESKLEFTGLASNKLTNQSAQICFASATVPKEMETKLFHLIKGNDMKIESTNYLHKVPSYAKQVFKRVTKGSRPEELLKIVKANIKTNIATMIFSNNLNTANWVVRFLKGNGIECGEITTEMFADDRLMHFRDFKAGITSVVSCTDLASRGLSFPRVKHVINFEFPSFMIDYIHRCGRTGRLGQGEDCRITSFISGKHEVSLLNKIELAARTNSPLPSIYQDRIKSYPATSRTERIRHFK